MDSPAHEQQETLNDELAKEFERLESEATEEEDVEETEIPTESDEEDGTEAADEDSEGDGNDEEDEVSDELKDEIEEAADSDYNEPAPERWPEEIKEVYNSLPPEGRKAMLDGVYKPMQASYTKATQQMAEMRRTLEPMMENLNNYRNTFERHGVSAEEVFRTQLAWAAHLQNVGPEQGLKDMAEAYGVKQQQLAAESDEQEYLTPFERKLQEKYEQQNQQLNTLMGQMNDRQQSEQQQAWNAQYNEVQSGLQTFINEQKDGKLAHPHVEAVAPEIAGIIRGGLVPEVNEYGQAIPVRDRLEAAYNMAVNMKPDLRPASSRTRGQVKRTKAARSVDVVAKSAASQSDVPERPLKEDISAMFDKMAGR